MGQFSSRNNRMLPVCSCSYSQKVDRDGNAVMTKAVHEELSSLPFTVKCARFKVGVGPKPSCSFALVGQGMKCSVCSTSPGICTSVTLHLSQGNTHCGEAGCGVGGETLQSKSSLSEEQLCAFVHSANRPVKRKSRAFTGEQPQSSCESFVLFTWRNFVGCLKETFTFPLENRLQSPREMRCEKARVGITGEMNVQSEPQTNEHG